VKTTRILLAAATLSTMTIIGCATTPPETASEQTALHNDADSALQRMYARDPGLRGFVQGGYAYAIFPSVGKGGLIAGGASGRGEVYEQGRFVGYAELNQVTVGAQAGGEEYAELIVFQDEAALRNFQNKEYSFSANASAVALKAGASKEGHFRDGVAVFTLPTGGLMAEASVGGQSFTYHPAANVDIRTDRSVDRDNPTYRSERTTTVNPPADHTTTYQRTETTTETPPPSR
jgi:lipid-binding SYLF domain-containing protein